MLQDNKVLVGVGLDNADRLFLLPAMANRHGLIAGATGTGKTVTLKVMAESFSAMGVPVFLSDVKGDLAGLAYPGEDNGGIGKRVSNLKLSDSSFRYQGFPVQPWDIAGERGLPLRTTISEMGPTLLSRLLSLSELQSDILSIIFRIADEEQLLLLDTKDLRAMLQYVSEHNKEYSQEYGNMSRQSINAILRAVVALETAGGDHFFGEPAIDIHDFFKTDRDGKGIINILDAYKTIREPRIYSCFMLYMLSELFEQLPELGDIDKPRLVFFFDEAHLLFDGAPKVLIEKIEQLVKLIRSKGVGVFFITQNPSDIPDEVLSQLGNKVQHALRAYTPSEAKKLKAAAASFRKNPAFDTEAVLSELGTGEALVSFLDNEGKPEPVHRAAILPPESLMGAIDDMRREALIRGSELYKRYDESIDRDSAYEFLKRQAQENEELLRSERENEERSREEELLQRSRTREEEKAQRQRQSAVKRVGRSTAGALGREVGYSIGKSLLGGSIGRRIGGNVGAALGRGILDTLFGR